MKKETFYKLHKNNLIGADVNELGSAKAFIRFSRMVLSNFQKSRKYLRKDETHPHWLDIKDICLKHIESIGKRFNIVLASLDPEYDEQSYISLLELVSSFSQALYEEETLDLNYKDKTEELTEEDLIGLNNLHSILKYNTEEQKYVRI